MGIAGAKAKRPAAVAPDRGRSAERDSPSTLFEVFGHDGGVFSVKGKVQLLGDESGGLRNHRYYGMVQLGNSKEMVSFSLR